MSYIMYLQRRIRCSVLHESPHGCITAVFRLSGSVESAGGDQNDSPMGWNSGDANLSEDLLIPDKNEDK